MESPNFMAYLHCHNCGWSQDDFWAKDGYNPFRQDIVNNLIEMLFEEEINVDRDYLADSGVKFRDVETASGVTGGYISGQEMVALVLERKARSIRNMLVKTNED